MGMNKYGRNRRAKIREFVRAVDVSDGDVILIKQSSGLSDSTVMNGIAAAMEKAGKPNCVMIVVDDFSDISFLTEEDMSRFGWVKNESKNTV